MTMNTPSKPYEGITPSVPKSFLRDLHKLDPGLDCYFSRKYHRFVITQEGKISGKVPVAIVNGYEDGSYRYPDQRDIINLQQADLHRNGQEIKDRIQKGEEYLNDSRDKSMDMAEDEIKNRTKEDKQQLLEAYGETYNLGKYNSAHRRVEARKRGSLSPRKGYTVLDRRVNADKS